MAALMLWEMAWALVFGFSISALLQVYVSKDQMARVFGKTHLKSVSLATVFGAASSSCSYAAAATAKTLFKKGAAWTPSIAFMIASTNLVIELGIVLWILLGWRFVLAEALGAVVMIAIFAGLFAWFEKAKWISEARQSPVAGQEHEHHQHHHSEGHDGGPRASAVAYAFVMDVSMLWKEILIGVLVAGFLMTLAPKSFWQGLFWTHGPHGLRMLENALVGPLVACASFVCSVGNVPLAGLLWSGGATFGGVIAFLYGDLIVFPLLLAYRKYYGLKAAVYLTLALYASMAGGGLIIDILFTLTGLAPSPSSAKPMADQAHFAWNTTTWLDLAACALAAWWLYLHLRKAKSKAQAAQAH